MHGKSVLKTRLFEQLSFYGVGEWVECFLSVFTVVIYSLLMTNLGTLFVKRRTGFLTYADDPKVSGIIRDVTVNLLLATTRRLDRDACFDTTTIIQGLKIIFDVLLQRVSSRPIRKLVRYLNAIKSQ